MRVATPSINSRKDRSVKADLCLQGKSEIVYEILTYLKDHPEAQDTLDGVVQWWLLERKIIQQTALVKEALTELVRKGMVLERKTRSAPPRYCLNQKRAEEISSILEKKARRKTVGGI